MRSCGIVVQEDNQAAIQLTENEAVTQRSRHINVKYHWLRDLVRDGLIVVEYCPTSHMVADTLRSRYVVLNLIASVSYSGTIEWECWNRCAHCSLDSQPVMTPGRLHKRSLCRYDICEYWCITRSRGTT